MIFKIFGTKIHITFLFTAFIAILTATDKSGLILPLIISATIHEAAHLFAMWICDCNPKSVKLIPGSIEISQGINVKCKNQIFISIGGPIINLILFAVLYLDYSFTKSDATLNFALINLILAIFNLLPAKSFDGGEILKILLLKKFSENKCKIIINLLTLIIALIFLTAGFFLLKNTSKNFSLIIVGLYLIISVLIKF